MTQYFVCREGEISDGGVRLIQVDRLEIGVFNQKDCNYAYQNYCPHQSGPAGKGAQMPKVVDLIGDGGIYLGQTYDENGIHTMCPWHSYEFHLSDGAHVCDEKLRLTKFEVVRRDGGAVSLSDATGALDVPAGGCHHRLAADINQRPRGIAS